MSTVNPQIQCLLTLSPKEMRLVTRALTGNLKKDRDYEEARKLGLRLLSQQIQVEEDRVEGLRGVLKSLTDGSGEPEVPEAPPMPSGPLMATLRPGSGPTAHR